MNFSWKLHIVIYACSDSVLIWECNENFKYAIYVARKTDEGIWKIWGVWDCQFECMIVFIVWKGNHYEHHCLGLE